MGSDDQDVRWLVEARSLMIEALARHMTSQGGKPDYRIDEVTVQHSTYRHTLVMDIESLDRAIASRGYAANGAA